MQFNITKQQALKIAAIVFDSEPEMLEATTKQLTTRPTKYSWLFPMTDLVELFSAVELVMHIEG